MPRFVRTRQLLGQERFGLLAGARVAVFGLGGVGSYAVEALARAGVGSLRLVDFDVVNISNINRQLFALESTVGRPKAEVAAERVAAINPNCVVDSRRAFVDGDSVAGLLEGPLDAVIDAIDSVSSKVHLIRESVQQGYFTVSSMGAAGRMGAEFVVVGDIAESFNCPLARIVRKRLRRQGIHGGVRCVYSPEPSLNKLPLLEDEVELVPQTRGRARTPLGSISHIPGVFGLHVAGEVISRIVGRSGSS